MESHVYLVFATISNIAFGRVCTGALDQMSNPVTVKNAAFRSCRLRPVNENAINYPQMKPAETFPSGIHVPSSKMLRKR